MVTLGKTGWRRAMTQIIAAVCSELAVLLTSWKEICKDTSWTHQCKLTLLDCDGLASSLHL